MPKLVKFGSCGNTSRSAIELYAIVSSSNCGRFGMPASVSLVTSDNVRFLRFSNSAMGARSFSSVERNSREMRFCARSEERRVGKEGKARRLGYEGRQDEGGGTGRDDESRA